MFKRTICFLSLLLLAGMPSSLLANQPDGAQILVFGGTGRLGSDVVKALDSAGHKVTVFARKTSDRKRLRNVNVDYVIGDVLGYQSLQRAISGHQFDVFVDALGRGSAGVEFFRDSARNIAASAAESKVQQIILHGSVGAGDSAAAFGGRFGSMADLFSAKTDGEQAVIASGVGYTIIRNSHLISYGTPESGNAELYEDQMTTGSVTRQGLARLTLSCVLKPACMNRIYHAVDKSLQK